MQHEFLVPLQLVQRDAPPPSPTPGTIYYDTSLNAPRIWDGTAWVGFGGDDFVAKDGDTMTGSLIIEDTYPGYGLEVGDIKVRYGIWVQHGNIDIDDGWLTISSGNFGGINVVGGFESYHDPATMPNRSIGFWRHNGSAYEALIAEKPHEPITKRYLDEMVGEGSIDEVEIGPTGSAGATTELWVDTSGDGSPADYLPRDGGTMKGPISMAGHSIGALPEPAANDDAATKGYVDGAVAAGVVISNVAPTNPTVGMIWVDVS